MTVKNERWRPRMSPGMVDITEKGAVPRMACAEGTIRLNPATVAAISKKRIPKGDVLAAAELAAIHAAKRTSELLFHCHPIPITGIEADFEVGKDRISSRVRVRSVGKTGVEMEALVGVAAALLTVWDMVKGLEKDERGQYPSTKIEAIRILKKVRG